MAIGGQSNATKKTANPAATHGWEGEVRQENIDSAVGAYLRVDGPQTYHQTYEGARRRLEAGEDATAIRQALYHDADLHEPSAEDSPNMADHKTIHNRVERHLCRIADQAIDGSLAGRSSSYLPPSGY